MGNYSFYRNKLFNKIRLKLNSASFGTKIVFVAERKKVMSNKHMKYPSFKFLNARSSEMTVPK